LLDISKWDNDDDPVTRGQVDVLEQILDGEIGEKALEGFLIVAPRFVNNFRSDRTEALIEVFRTKRPEGKRALRRSLAHVCDWNGGLQGYEARYPVSIIPPRPAFPLFRILDLQQLAASLYRVLDSQAKVASTNERATEFITRTGRLPPVPIQRRPVRRSKPQFHWCSYTAFSDPDLTRTGLQILPEWSDCRVRATLSTRNLVSRAYVAFNGDRWHPDDKKLRFYNYFYEPLAQDHPALLGGGTQIGVEGGPIVETLEQWDEDNGTWRREWSKGAVDRH
jgi:hypothetical protein